MEPKLNEVFVMNGKAFRCVVGLQGECGKCAFLSSEGICDAWSLVCSGELRADHADVVFVEVQEELNKMMGDHMTDWQLSQNVFDGGNLEAAKTLIERLQTQVDAKTFYEKKAKAWDALVAQLAYLNQFAGTRSENKRFTDMVDEIWEEVDHD